MQGYSRATRFIVGPRGRDGKRWGLAGDGGRVDNKDKEEETMPLHDWTDDRGWDSVHQLWINALLFWAQERLPSGYRAYLGSVPGLSIGTEPDRPDRGVRSWQPQGEEKAPSEAPIAAPPPDFNT